MSAAVLCAAPAAPQSVDSTLIEELVLANRILALEGVVDSQGHVSVRHPGDPNRYLISYARAPQLVEATDILEFNLDSAPLDARGRRPYRERFIHGEIYKARPDVMAVVGPTLRHAVGRGVYLEVNARLQQQAMALGGTIEYRDPEEARRIEARRDYDRQWELWKRKVSGK